MRGIVGGCAVLLALCGIAAFAPLLANDRPLFVRGVDRALADEYAQRLPQLAAELARVAALSDGEYVAQRRATSRQSQADAVVGLAAGVASRARLLARYVDAESSAQLLRDARVCGELGIAFARGGRDDATARSERERAVADAAAVAASCMGWSRGERAPGRTGWRAASSFPVFESLGRVDWFCMLAWPVLACCAFTSWRAARRASADAAPMRGDARGTESPARGAALARTVLCVLGLVLLACALHTALYDERSARRADWKLALAERRYEATRVLHPPLAMGFAESHPEEAWLPPSVWRTSAESEIALEPLPGEAALDSAWRHPLGTDGLGRDLAARLAWGARASLGVGAAAAALLVLLGCAVGALAGSCGGRVDWIALRGIEVAACVPSLFLALAVLAFTDPRVLDPAFAVVLVIGALGWPGIARLLRAEILRVRALEYAEAARALGLRPARVLVRHVLPSALPPVIVAGSFAVGACLLSEAALSYLGLGVRPPLASWGALAAESRQAEHWWVQLFPGLAIFATAAACNRIGEALRDRLDPRRVEPRA